MKKFVIFVLLLLPFLGFSQNDQLAQNYFDKGEFEKALIAYQDLAKTQPSNSLFFQRIVESYQQLEQLDAAEKVLTDRLAKYKQASLLVDLGYNFHLRKDEVKAKKFYDQALGRVRENPNEVYGVAMAFERKAIIDRALEAYNIALAADSRLNFNYQMAQLYGQSGNTDMMISTYLDEAYKNPNSAIMIQNQLSRFMTEEGDTTFNDTLRKALLVRAQKGQDIFWNHFLSWYFVQRKEYGKAFIQEKAIYKREPETFANIVSLAQLAIDENDEATATEILGFVLENTQDLDVLVQSHYFLARMRVSKATPKEYPIIEQHLQSLITQYGISPYTLSLQILQAHFVTFSLNRADQGKAILKTALELPLNKYQTADAKMELADIFLFEQKFNQALLYYSQIEEDLKNDATGHQASLKAAKTSYFKADFLYAQSQFRVLKSATSQLIANDALEYFLLISDNTVADSTQTALRKFAHADYLLYQNKKQEALAAFESILKSFKGDEIEAVTLLRMGRTNQQLGQFMIAIGHYDNIIANHGESIYVDEALYFSAEIFNDNLKDPDKAKALYEKILFNHQDSIYFIDARKKFRTLRGDANL